MVQKLPLVCWCADKNPLYWYSYCHPNNLIMPLKALWTAGKFLTYCSVQFSGCEIHASVRRMVSTVCATFRLEVLICKINVLMQSRSWQYVEAVTRHCVELYQTQVASVQQTLLSSVPCRSSSSQAKMFSCLRCRRIIHPDTQYVFVFSVSAAIAPSVLCFSLYTVSGKKEATVF